jgi:hypothetical protein
MCYLPPASDAEKTKPAFPLGDAGFETFETVIDCARAD